MMRGCPIAFQDPRASSVRNTAAVCIACAEGDHERVLLAHERCACPCHGIVIPSQAVAA